MHQPFRNTQPTDVYGAFEFRARSPKAQALVEHLHAAILKTETRKRKRREGDAERFKETVERFVGELLHAKARKDGTGRFWRSMSTRGFSGDVVSQKNVKSIREALEALKYLKHTKGSPKFGPDFDNGISQYKGEAAKFEATPQLIGLPAGVGVTLPKVSQHFRIKHDPIEARMSSTSDWSGKQQGAKVHFEHTPKTSKLEQEVVALNEFMKGFKVGGASHDVFYRLFNECDDLSTYQWNKGGRLYSDSGSDAPSYQALSNKSSEQGGLRSRITIGGEVNRPGIAGGRLV